MTNKIKKNDGLYLDALAWMGYRYAMGMTDYVGRKGLVLLSEGHKTCRVWYDGKKELVRYFDAWQRRYNADGKTHYEKVKVPIDKFKREPWAGWALIEENIVEDDIK